MSNLLSISECLKNPKSVLHAHNQMHPLTINTKKQSCELITDLINNHLSQSWQSVADIAESGGEHLTDNIRIIMSSRLNALAKKKKVELKKIGRNCFYRL